MKLCAICCTAVVWCVCAACTPPPLLALCPPHTHTFSQERLLSPKLRKVNSLSIFSFGGSSVEQLPQPQRPVTTLPSLQRRQRRLGPVQPGSTRFVPALCRQHHKASDTHFTPNPLPQAAAGSEGVNSSHSACRSRGGRAAAAHRQCRG